MLIILFINIHPHLLLLGFFFYMNTYDAQYTMQIGPIFDMKTINAFVLLYNILFYFCIFILLMIVVIFITMCML